VHPTNQKLLTMTVHSKTVKGAVKKWKVLRLHQMATAQGKGFEVVGKDGEVQAKTIDGAEEVKVAQGKGVKSTLNGGRVASLGKGGKRHRKVLHDTVDGISKAAIRRLARHSLRRRTRAKDLTGQVRLLCYIQ
jgi:hypothetical protein